MAVSAFVGFAGSLSVLTLVLMAALSDLRTMRISNTIPVALILFYFGVAPLTGATAAEIGLGVLAAALVLAVGFALHCQGWIGGGDVKLAAAIALWLGPSHTLGFLLYTTLLGAAFAVLLLSIRRRPLPVSLQKLKWVSNLHAGRGMPYGVPIALAALLTFPETRHILPLLVG